MSGPLYLHVCPYKRAETRLRRWNPSLNRATLTPANDCGSIAYRKRPLTPRPFRWAPRGWFWYVHFTAFHHLVISNQRVHLSRGLRTWIQAKSVESQARVALIIIFTYTIFFLVKCCIPFQLHVWVSIKCSHSCKTHQSSIRKFSTKC